MMEKTFARTLTAVAAVFTAVALLAPGAGAETEAKESTENKKVADPIATIDAFIAEQKVDKSDAQWKLKLNKPPQAAFDASKDYFWMIETTEGPIKVKLRPDVAPMHASSTIYLSRLGFYDGLAFHRVTHSGYCL